MFNAYFLKTKLGQDCRSVGQSQPISNAAGIDVDRTRIIATMISTVLAAWGMIIYLQDMGTVSAYTAQRQIGMFSVATLLVGGATVSRANAKNVILGLILFHSMFIVSPGVGRLFPTTNENVGEYIRSFMVYAVIGISLGLHVWKTNKAARDKERLNPQEVSLLDQARAKRNL
jgi:simple sugar transport system permease protein